MTCRGWRACWPRCCPPRRPNAVSCRPAGTFMPVTSAPPVAPHRGPGRCRYAALAAQIVAAAIECVMLSHRANTVTRDWPNDLVEESIPCSLRMCASRSACFAGTRALPRSRSSRSRSASAPTRRSSALSTRCCSGRCPTAIRRASSRSGRRARGRLTTVSPPNFVDWKMQSRSFEHMTAYNDATATLTVGEEPEQIPAAVVGADFFDVLGVKPMLGRGFLPVEERPGGPHVTVLGYALWQRRFGGDPTIRRTHGDVRQRRATRSSASCRASSGSRRTSDCGFRWCSPPATSVRNQRGAHYIGAIGPIEARGDRRPGDRRSRGDRTVDRAAVPRARSAATASGRAPIFDAIVGDVRRPLLMLLGAVAFVLLIACVNVSNLLLARSTTRRTEIALRSALGAGRWRIVRQLLAESVLLSLAGGVAGVLLATWGVRVLSNLSAAGPAARRERRRESQCAALQPRRIGADRRPVRRDARDVCRVTGSRGVPQGRPPRRIANWPPLTQKRAGDRRGGALAGAARGCRAGDAELRPAQRGDARFRSGRTPRGEHRGARVPIPGLCGAGPLLPRLRAGARRAAGRSRGRRGIDPAPRARRLRRYLHDRRAHRCPTIRTCRCAV